jgi:hypothetical protein
MRFINPEISRLARTPGPKLLRLIPLTLILVISVCSRSESQTSTPQVPVEQQLPTVSLKILLIPQPLVCKINGRPSSYSGGRCDELTADDITELEKVNAAISQTKAAPPGEVILDPSFRNSLDTYRSRSRKRDIWDLQSVVLVFRWESPQGTPEKPLRVALKRDEPTRNPPNFVHSGQLRAYQIWFYHESADSFLPGDGIQWTFQVGDKGEELTWKFRALRQ